MATNVEIIQDHMENIKDETIQRIWTAVFHAYEYEESFDNDFELVILADVLLELWEKFPQDKTAIYKGWEEILSVINSD